MTRVESFYEKRDSSRATIFLNVTRVESPKTVTRVTLSLKKIVADMISKYRNFSDTAIIPYQLLLWPQFFSLDNPVPV